MTSVSESDALDTGERQRTLLRTTQELPVAGASVISFLTQDRPRAARYLISVGITLLASGATILLAPHLERVVFVLVWPAVLLSALLGGFWPAAVSAVVGIIVVDTWVLPPRGVFSADPRDIPSLLIFFLAALAMSSVANALRVARTRGAAATAELQHLALELEQQAIELEQQLEESQALQEELEQTSAELAERTTEAERASAFSQGILASIAEPFVVHDADWRFVYMNEQAAAIFRRSGRGDRASLIGKRLWDEYPDIVGTPHEREMRRAATERVPVTYEAYYAEAGTWSVLSCYPLPDGGLATQWRDVTARRRADEAARYLSRASEVLGASLEYETTLRDLADVVVPELATWCAVYVLDGEGQPRQVALAHADSAMVSFAQELGRRYPADPSSPRGVHAVARTGEPVLAPDITDDLLVASARDPEHLAIMRKLDLRSAMMVPLLAQDRVLGVLALYSVKGGRRYGPDDLALATELARRAALAVDNSLRHQAERQARMAADDANRVKMQFLAVMSHELRTPLNAIGGYAELMRLGLRGPVTEAQLQDLQRITNSQRSLLGLINDILNFAKVEAGQVEFRIGEVPLRPLIRDLEDVVRPQLLSGALDFSAAECDDGLAVRGDREKIRQVVLNLLSNAIKFTAPGGRIRIRCRADDTRVRVDVEDTGIGIDASRLETVFDPFVQLDRSLTSQHEGTGLGLAISRDLARAMQGDVTATSEPGRGSVFTLTLPAVGR